MSPAAPRAFAADPALIASVLSEAVPYLARYAGKTITVKYGGHAMGAGGDTFAGDVGLGRAGRFWQSGPGDGDQ